MAIYEPRVTRKVDSLLSRLAAHSGTPINMTDYIMFFGFDVMGEVGKAKEKKNTVSLLVLERRTSMANSRNLTGLSKDFHMVENETEHSAIKGVHESMMAIGVFGTVPWLLSMLGKIPGAAGGYLRFTQWCHDQLQEKHQVWPTAYGSDDS